MYFVHNDDKLHGFGSSKAYTKNTVQSDVLVYNFEHNGKPYKVNFPRQAFVTPSFEKTNDSKFQNPATEDIDEIDDEECADNIEIIGESHDSDEGVRAFSDVNSENMRKKIQILR